MAKSALAEREQRRRGLISHMVNDDLVAEAAVEAVVQPDSVQQNESVAAVENQENESMEAAAEMQDKTVEGKATEADAVPPCEDSEKEDDKTAGVAVPETKNMPGDDIRKELLQSISKTIDNVCSQPAKEDRPERVQRAYMIDKDLAKALQVKSTIEGRSISNIVNEILRPHLEKYVSVFSNES